ncbi:hypothetical protein [Ornithinibacillus halotolerans]|uniref:DUF2178 domain-containing protein n=1 Tax=Ornithinibacillus halotolerans TaxID=1274357 RepID=A0A916W9K8_9BACI|nr:hypothetical protein [Ornithinibacillus halotolerans]GGA80260.1 hypothetical protein GCM10008025_24580 [Ornithinibacillus halotolerans]
MDKSRKVIAFFAFIVFAIVAGFTLYKYLRFGTIDGAGIFFSFVALSYLFNMLTWGNHEGGGEKDEMDKHIEAQSAKIGYFVLMILAALILVLSEGISNFNDIDNYPLLIVVGLTIVTLPITEFIYSKKFK